MKKFAMMVMMIVMVAAMPAAAAENKAVIPNSMFAEIVEDVESDIQDMIVDKQYEEVYVAQKESKVDYQAQTGSWSVLWDNGDHVIVTIEDGEMKIDYKEGHMTVTAECSLMEYYETEIE